MKLKAVFMSAILFAVCAFSSCGGEKLLPLEERNSPPILKFYDPTSPQTTASDIAPACYSWNFTEKGSRSRVQGVTADAVHPLDESALLVKVSFDYEYPMFEFEEAFKPNKIELSGWDISKKGDTSSKTVYKPKTYFEQNFPSAVNAGGYYSGIGTPLEKNMIYRFTVTYDKTPYLASFGFYGTVSYYFET